MHSHVRQRERQGTHAASREATPPKHNGRLAQWESTSLTRKGSLVQSQYRPPFALRHFGFHLFGFLTRFEHELSDRGRNDCGENDDGDQRGVLRLRNEMVRKAVEGGNRAEGK